MRNNLHKTRFETILERHLGADHSVVHGYGITSPAALALLLSKLAGGALISRPHLVVCPNQEIATDFHRDLEFFLAEPVPPPLFSFDVSPYSGLTPNSRSSSERIRWLHSARSAQGGDFLVASVAGLCQKTLPFDLFDKSCRLLSKGRELPSDFRLWLLHWGYNDSPRVEDPGQFSMRGGILDIFSPSLDRPIRLELFGDTIESLRTFDPETQRSIEELSSAEICTAKEALFLEERRQDTAVRLKASLEGRSLPKRDQDSLLHDVSLGRYFPGTEFLLPFLYDAPVRPFDFFLKSPLVWILDEMGCVQANDTLLNELRDDWQTHKDLVWAPPPAALFCENLGSSMPTGTQILLSKLRVDTFGEDSRPHEFDFPVHRNLEFRNAVQTKASSGEDFAEEAKLRINGFKSQGYCCVIFCSTLSQTQRLSFLLERAGLTPNLLDGPGIDIEDIREKQSQTPGLIHLIQHTLGDSFRAPEEHLLFLSEEDFFAKKSFKREHKRAKGSAVLKELDFGDLKVGDYVVHILHGVGIFDGLKLMNVQGVPSEFIQLTYKDGDRLFVPIYRIGQIQKFSGIPTLDKLGGGQWQKTKIKVKSHLRDLASDLLQLYAKRSQIQRAAYPPINAEYSRFEATFPYDETDDQLAAIDGVLHDFEANKPMDRLVCGDVGFGKTEVALRAAFRAVQSGRQVALLVPTTVLAFQHLETFRARFKGFPYQIGGFSRFTDKKELRENVEKVKNGLLHIAIGTHRLLSKDILFQDLGLLIVDEEQKFGVAHKERIRKLRAQVDTLTLSATPIPRTLNLSLVGIRDLSLIQTAPKDRLPIRTFVCRFERETIRSAILNEIRRGGQVFYLHNRVQSIQSLADELRELVPEARIRVGHGQMGEGELEEVMVAFFKHEFDVLLCTTIIESGMDIPRANTMIVDRADTFGLSQLYQIRGRIGRSKERAYCYLLVPSSGAIDPEAQERLRVLQENSALGSGFRIAQHDLELRGAGNILGEAQSGNINAVGYELYLELLEDALREARGDTMDEKEIEPDINLKIPALIPDSYMADIRSRLGYYKKLSNLRGVEDLDQIEAEMHDLFGAPPEQVTNLFGVMLIRRVCKELGVRDISAGAKTISLAFTEQTKVDPKVMVELALREKKRYSLTPDSRLIIRLETQAWPEIHEELLRLKKLAHLL